jgi:hypothetical protein
VAKTFRKKIKERERERETERGKEGKSNRK